MAWAEAVFIRGLEAVAGELVLFAFVYNFVLWRNIERNKNLKVLYYYKLTLCDEKILQ